MVKNRFFLNLRITEDLFCWKDTTFKNNKQLLLLYQVESEICKSNYEIKGHSSFPHSIDEKTEAQKNEVISSSHTT